MNISMIPVDLLKFTVYFWKQKDINPNQDQVVEHSPSQKTQDNVLCCYSYLVVSNDGIIEDIVHSAGGAAFLHLSPETHETLLQQIHGHFTLEGDNWRQAHFLNVFV